ncbi:helix-turn-helix domain-containing protein [Streptomyces asiaticus]|uniref:helix-turn-helix domain-containing protein n=1 Tax=Streptomyces asiaticus TaxID=114695 RepID=UPI003F67FDDE
MAERLSGALDSLLNHALQLARASGLGVFDERSLWVRQIAVVEHRRRLLFCLCHDPKARGFSQVALARRAGVSVSLLSKIEVGDRALTQGIAAALAQATGLTLDELLGTAPVERSDEKSLAALNYAIRRFDIPDTPPTHPEDLPRGLAELNEHRYRTELSAVLQKLPGVLADATNYAHATQSPDAWTRVADTYSVVYWLAARHRWMHLAELAVMKQRLAAERAHPIAATVAARDEAGTFLNSGDFAGGLAIVDRAVVEAESTLRGRDRAYGLGILHLHLRGLTLAGRVKDKATAERHIEAAWQVAEEFPEDVEDHGIHFGPENTAVHVISTASDREDYRESLNTADDLIRGGVTLPATRVGPLHMNISRSKLALGTVTGLSNRSKRLGTSRPRWPVSTRPAKS